MKQNITIWVLILIICNITQAQDVKSQKSFFKLNNKPTIIIDEKKDKILPKIQILSPTGVEDEPYKTDSSEIFLIGKATDENGISSVKINTEELEISDEGIFKSRLLLNPGENEYYSLLYGYLS